MLGSIRVLCVEDDPVSARLMAEIVRKEGGRVDVAASAKAGLQACADDPPDLCLFDISLPDASGLDLLLELRGAHPGLPVIMVTTSDSVSDVVMAMRRGACDYITKPVDPQRLVISMRNAVQMADQQKEIMRLRTDVREAYAVEHLVGSSPAMERVRDLIRKAGPSDASVLVVGESGTGKELVARALHSAGPRSAGPFVDVNSAALTETLLESELFGHEKGAFTNAVSRHQGRFEQAHGGTILLDEIGDMPPATQAKILRVLEERAFQRVGGGERIAVDVRVICATNNDLEDAVQRETFRKDLFYRVNTFVITIPPLRERKEDIPELVRHFLARAVRREKRDVRGISASALEALRRHDWPGNVRELEHVVDRAVLVGEGHEIRPQDIPPAVLGAPEAVRDKPEGLVEAVEDLERSMIVAALEKNGGVRSKAARSLGITERMISYKMPILGIRKPGT